MPLVCDSVTFHRPFEYQSRPWLKRFLRSPEEYRNVADGTLMRSYEAATKHLPLWKQSLFGLGVGVLGSVLSDKRSRLVHDALRDPEYLATNRSLSEEVSLLVVPMLIGSRCTGIITAQKFKKRAFSDYDLNLIERVLQQVALTIEKTMILELLEEINIKINEETDQDSVLRSIVEAAITLTDSTSGVIHVLSEVPSMERPPASWDSDYPSEGPRGYSFVRSVGIPSGIHPEPRLTDPKSASNVVLREDHVVQFSPFFQNSETIRPQIRDAKVRVVAGIALRFNINFYGVLFLNSVTKQERFDEIEEYALRLLAGQAGIALRNKALLHATNEYSKGLEALAEAINHITKQTIIEDIFQTITQQAQELLDATYSYLVLIKYRNGDPIYEFEAASPRRYLAALSKKPQYFDPKNGTPNYSDQEK